MDTNGPTATIHSNGYPLGPSRGAGDVRGEILQLKDTMKTMVEQPRMRGACD
jgi:hypothetical protein